jgi:hypothetical protein
VNGTGPRSPFTSQGIGEPPAEADAGIGDENQLLGIHDLCPVMALMFERNQQMDFRQKTTRLQLGTAISLLGFVCGGLAYLLVIVKP